MGVGGGGNWKKVHIRNMFGKVKKRRGIYVTFPSPGGEADGRVCED